MKMKEIQVSYKLTQQEVPDHKIETSESVYKIFKELTRLDREKFRALHLNRRNKIIGFEVVSIGSLTESIVHPREVFKSAFLHNACSLILVHNHPSGEAQPSEEDKRVTTILRDAGELLGITVLDHIIIGEDGYFSFADSGMI